MNIFQNNYDGCGRWGAKYKRAAARATICITNAGGIRDAPRRATSPAPSARGGETPPEPDNITINTAWTLFGYHVIADCGPQ